jgi:hypothetical protein
MYEIDRDRGSLQENSVLSICGRNPQAAQQTGNRETINYGTN